MIRVQHQHEAFLGFIKLRNKITMASMQLCTCLLHQSMFLLHGEVGVHWDTQGGVHWDAIPMDNNRVYAWQPT